MIKFHLGNRPGFSIRFDWNGEKLVGLKSVHKQPVPQHRDAIENPALGAESAVTGPHLQLMASRRKTIDLHVVCIGNIRGAVVSDRDVVAKGALGRKWIAFLGRSGFQIECFQNRRRRIVDRRKTCPEGVGFLVGKNTQHSEFGFIVGLDPGFGRGSARFHDIDGPGADAADDDSAVRRRGNAFRIDFLPRNLQFGRRCSLPTRGCRMAEAPYIGSKRGHLGVGKLCAAHGRHRAAILLGLRHAVGDHF